jgi:carboxymethylenebutenolidase
LKMNDTIDQGRRDLLKNAGAVGVTLAVAPEVLAQDKGAVKDSALEQKMVQFKNGGDTINGYLARPHVDKRIGAVIVIPGIFGLDDYIKETTAQIAQAGLAALALDFYSRKKPPTTDDFAVLRPFVNENAPDKQIVDDALAALAYLKTQSFVNGKYGITGFCMGGRITLLTAAASSDIVAASPYYGPVKAMGPANLAPMDVTDKIKAAVQGHYGVEDMNPKPEDVKAFYDKLKATNPHGEYHIYEGAGHAFHTFNRPMSYRPTVAALAWSRTLEFFKKTLA